MEKKKKLKNPSPRHSANILSRFLFWYLKSLLERVRSGKARATELSYDSAPRDRSELLGNRLETKWKKEVEDATKAESGGPRLWRAIFRAFKLGFIQHALQLVFLELVIRMVQPLLILSSQDYCRYGYIVLLSLQALLASHVRLQQRENGARLRSACASLIYRKITRLACSFTSQTNSKAIVYLLEEDIKNFDKFFIYIHNIWITPVQVIAITCLAYNKVGASCLLGVFLLLIQGIPVRKYCNKLSTSFHFKITSWTKERTSIMTEVLGKIRETKIYCWEKLIEKIIYINRRYEIDILKIASYTRGLLLASYVFSEYTSLLSVILSYALLGHAFEHEKIFLLVLYFYILHESMIYTFPEAVTTVFQAHNSVKRIEQFLLLEEVERNVALSMLSNDDTSVSVKDVSASWTNNANINLLESIDMCITPKKLYAISGPAGAGKTSLLKLILGELRPSSGEISVNGSISYASQEPWFFLGTLRDNILCSEVYDELQYKQIIEICGLPQVFENLPKGDETLMLSGETALTCEQEMKINLARALYREADIYLFDEIFTLLDNKVFEDSINVLLKDKTRIIVFKQDSPHLKLADEIILFEHGQIEFQGSYESYEQSSKFIEPLNDKSETPAPVKESEPEVKLAATLPLNTYHYQEKTKEEEELDETQELLSKTNSSDWLYWRYLKAGGSYFAIGSLMLFCILAQTSICGSDYWLGHWTNREMFWKHNHSWPEDFKTPERNPETENLLYTYSSLVLGTIVLFIGRNVLFFRICFNGSENIHNKMVSRLLRAPMRFFYGNPSEVILQRFSKDIGEIDNYLPESLLEAFHILFTLFGASLIMSVINYWSIIPIFVVGFLYSKLICLYASTIPKLKLLEQNASKKTLYHVESTLCGLPTIRNSRAQRLVLRGFSAGQDSRSSAQNLFLSAVAGLRFWLDLLLAILGTLVIVALLMLKDKITQDISYSFLVCIALTVKQFMVISRVSKLGMKTSAKIIEQKARLERVSSYTELEQEALSEDEAQKKQLKNWPSSGEIKFDHLYVRYCESDEPVLANLDLTIEAGSKVLIIENAESQKSSLTAAVYRLADVEGSLIIDGIDCTKDLSLPQLRQAIAYVTQESVFLAEAGCLRDSLDPDHDFDDAQIWDALEVVDMKKLFASLEHSCCHLCPSRRKLLSLARAILRKSKILVVDETTFTEDSNDILQRVLKDIFAECTILTISYKSRMLKIRCDKVVVISEDGEATEYECKDDGVQNDRIFS